MKLVLLGFLAVVGVLVAGCGAGSAPAGVPTAADARRAGVSLDDAGEGHAVFLRKCMECHEPKIPAAPLSPGWHATADGMAWNAGLSKREEEALLAYLQAANPEW